jgi:hypothetical protein
MTRIIISKAQAHAINWDDDSNKQLIRACFYLGYAITFMIEIVNNPILQEEAQRVVDCAVELGMDDTHPIIEVTK